MFAALLALAPETASAQSSPESEKLGASRVSTPSGPQLRILQDEAIGSASRVSPWTRRILAFLAGSLAVSLGSAVRGFIGTLVALPFVTQNPGPAGPAAPLIGISISIGVGALASAPLGVYFVGNELGGNGSLLAAYLGATALSVVTAAAALLLAPRPSFGPPLIGPTFAGYAPALFAPIGAVIGYEISHDPNASDDEQEATAKRNGVSLYPTVSPAAGSGAAPAIGVGGRF